VRSSNEVLGLIDSSPFLLDGVDSSIQKRFRSWVVVNMHVLNRFEEHAIELRQKGNRKRYGIKMILERLRWDSAIAENGQEYKINNNFPSCISRVLMALNPELRGMFQVRAHQLVDGGARCS
jgi:hypothetical protein